MRLVPEDFEVEEIGRIEPADSGNHLWLWVEKRGANTAWVADQLARVAGCSSRDVGYAGMKDRHALARQWFSIPAQGVECADCSAWRIEGVAVLAARRHTRKLQRGALAGNRFRIVLRALEGDAEALDARLRHIAQQGVPNYFGDQRFGHGGGNVRDGVEWLRNGGRLRRSLRGIYLSAVRSALFNEVLAARVAAGTWNRLLQGEIAMLDGTHSLFACPVVDEQLEHRCRAFDLHPTGPLPGRGGLQPAGEAAEVERRVVGPHVGLATALSAAGLEGDRRSLRLRPANLTWRIDAGSLTLGFELPAGAYATALIRELVTVAA